MAQGQSAEDACLKLGVSKLNFELWTREYGGGKPAYIKCLEALAEIDKKGNVPEFVAKFSEFHVYQQQGFKAQGISFSLNFKIALLTRLSKMIVAPTKKPRSSDSGESWGSDGGQANTPYKRANEALIDEFSNIIRFYMMRANKAGTPVNGNLVSDITLDVKGKVGELVSNGLLALLSNRELSPKQQIELKEGWLLLGSYIDRLLRMGT
ncbi:hypothetical protein BEN30_06825 [Magnetovibrio blakemorei]|uniref:Uncharacterized protein n=2 Tax=Magnetovibrio blakemorei TaxID=28181 RepID=A0A1E5Q9H8_9PROT|nr:hypothetical protein BEN30_06825 [Magnetovibrio blakemorei]